MFKPPTGYYWVSHMILEMDRPGVVRVLFLRCDATVFHQVAFSQETRPCHIFGENHGVPSQEPRVGTHFWARHRTQQGISLAIKFTKKMSVPSKDWK